MFAGHLFFDCSSPVPVLPPLTKQSAPKKAGVLWPLLIWSTAAPSNSIGDP